MEELADDDICRPTFSITLSSVPIFRGGRDRVGSSGVMIGRLLAITR